MAFLVKSFESTWKESLFKQKLLESFFLVFMKQKVISVKNYEGKRQSVCGSVCLSVCLPVCGCIKLNCLRLKFFEFDLMNDLTSLFQWINKETKDSCQKGTSLACVPTRFQISLRAPKLLTKKAKIKSQLSHGHWLKIS